MEDQKFEIDITDKRILNALIQDAQLPFTKVGELAHVSDGTVHVRMKKLQQLGVVSGSGLRVNYGKLGLDLIAFVGVYLTKGSVYQNVISAFKNIPEITEAYYTTGEYSIFLKLVCRNTENLRAVLNGQIQSIEGVERTESLISLDNPINREIQL